LQVRRTAASCSGRLAVSSPWLSERWTHASSDKPEKLLRFNGAYRSRFVRMGVESIQPPKPFQSEYKVRFRFAALSLRPQIEGTAL
jgi:hypothetical protein